jgi:hypothetical protein
MDDLFRFMLLRPANLPADDDVKVLEPGRLDTGRGREVARREAVKLLAGSRGIVRRTEDLQDGDVALAVRAALDAGPLDAGKLTDLVTARTGKQPADLVGDDAFTTDESRLADTLVATKLVSSSADTDARGLAAAAQGYDALRRLAGGEDPVRLRPLQMPTFGRPDDREQRYEDRRLSHVDVQRGAAAPAPDDIEADPEIRRIDHAISALGALRADDFQVPRESPTEPRARVERLAERLNRVESELGQAPAPGGASELRVGTPWQLRSEAVDRLPAAVRDTLKELHVDASRTTVPEALQTLQEARVRTLSTKAAYETSVDRLVQVGSSFVTAASSSDYVGSPGAPMPTGHGSITPVGIGDLLIVKQHVLRYEGGEVAHVENVLKSEVLDRETRRLDRTETTVLVESERTKEEERDNQSTDRFSLKRETDETLKSETEFKAGLQVDAKYGTFVEVKASAYFATKSSSEESTKQASEFSKDVVARSVSKVVERVLERRSTTTISEFEEKYRHGFDNTAGDGNISGVYQWVDKVLQAQVYNYGKRMLFDVTVPEPGTAFVVAQSADKAAGQEIVKPTPFTLTADQITEWNYTYYGHVYDVTGLEAPPPPVKTVSKAFDAVVPEDPHESSKSQDLAIDDGYRAKYALFECGYWYYDGAAWSVMIGSNFVDALANQSYFNMSGEVGSVSVAYYGHGIRDLAATVEVFCERTERAMKAWQLKTHAAITQGYLAKQQAYESKLAEAAAAAGVVIAGRNPLWNQRIATTELRKQCITMLTAQQFESFGALELSPQGYPQPNLARAETQMPYVRFFEQAFEWEHLVYFFYPYFWGWKPAWTHRMLLDDVDPQFADFLRAGAARVVFPVRPGFEAAVAHYLETGEIWNGGPAPDVNDPLYVPIIKEIQEAQGAPGDEVPQGDPWLVRLPTTLTKLRADDELPTWKKVGEDWQPDN